MLLVLVGIAAVVVVAAAAVDNVRFLDAAETNGFLGRDEDGYVRNMKPKDLKKRGGVAYAQIAARAGRDFTPREMERVRHAARVADRIAPRNLRDIPWTFAKVDASYEQALPHTRANIIFLYDKNTKGESFEDLVNTLVHEKVHVYQRFNGPRVLAFLRALGYRRVGPSVTRANPDTDGWAYVRIDGTPIDEHPYEEMAYDVAFVATKIAPNGRFHPGSNRFGELFG